MTWLEFSVPVADDPTRVLATAVVPFLARLRADGQVRRGLFLRERGAVLAQVVPAPGADLVDRVRELGEGATLGPAAVVPLTGPVFSGADLGPATRDFLAAASPLLGDLLAGERSAMLSTVLDVLAAHLQAVAGPRTAAQAGLPEGLPLSYLSFRSHAEAFIATTKDPDATRRALRGRYEAMRESLDARVRDVLDQVAGGPVRAPEAQTWFDHVRDTKPGLVERFRAGTLVAHTEYSQVHLRERTDFADNTFHSTAGGSADLQNYLSTDTSFLATRLLTSLLYLSLHTLGISLTERYVLCYAIASACESVFDVDGLAVLTSLTSA
ncbi:hypothetical protein ACFQV2_14810 [Actinokineospora soli]|uniref:Lantibiotic biosynthesis dehydratase C-term n=1 Tax=Actinokineospora soli TaxID=1048753 RepID=A0ABW2TN98_9PSEU